MIKEFKNTLHLKLEKEEKKEVKKYSDVEALCYLYDFYPVSDNYCISNYMMAIDFSYNGGSNYFSITFQELEDFKSGKMIILKKLGKRYINKFILNDE